MSEFAQILMAIDNIEHKCFHRDGQAKNLLRQNIPSEIIKPANYNNFATRTEYAHH